MAAWLGILALVAVTVRTDVGTLTDVSSALRCTIVGTPRADVLVGTSRADVICGLGGNDRIDGRGGDDLVLGGPGSDTVVGGTGNDRLRGGTGNDAIRGDAGNDVLWGGGGNDILAGSAGNDYLGGGSGRDELRAVDLRGARDQLVCGDGSPDRALANRADVVSRTCESITRSDPKPPNPPSPPTPPVEPGRSPVAVDDTVQAVEDTELVLPARGPGSPVANDSDADGDLLRVSAVADPVGGTVTLAEDVVTFTPAADLCGPASGRFTYTVSDGTGRSATGRTTIDVTCTADDPTAADDTAVVLEDSGATTLDVLGNDVDPDGDPITIEAATQPAHGSTEVTDQGVRYTPDADYCNSSPGSDPDTFTYTLTPGGSTASVAVTVTCVVDAAVAADDSATVAEDAAAGVIPVLDNDDEREGATTIVSTTDPAHGDVVVTGEGAGLTYAPDTDYCNDPAGTDPDVFTYTLEGGSTATVSVTVTCADDPPVAVDDAWLTQEDAGATAVPVLANDTDVDGGEISISDVEQPTHGTATITGVGSGLTYEPDPGYCNTQLGGQVDTFSYTLSPGDATATVTVTVSCVPDSPVVADDEATLAEDAAATTIDVLANDVAGDDPLDVASVTQPARGTATVVGGGTGVSYAPDADYCNTPPGTSPDSFTYELTGSGATGTVTVAVTCVDDVPVASDDAATVTEDAAATAVPVLDNDDDVDGGARSVASVTQPAHGSVTITGGGSGLSYTPSADYCNAPGSPADTFTYTLSPGTSTATVSMTVTCVNDAPVASDASFAGARAAIGNTTLAVDGPGAGAPNVSEPHRAVTGDLLAGASDVEGDTISVRAETLTTSGSGSVVLESDGSFVYTPAAGCTTSSDHFDVTVTDDAESPATSTARVTIELTGCAWYVSNDAAGDAGTSAAPFDTLAQAQAAASTGSTVYVFGGDGTSTGYDAGITLQTGQRLVGEATDLVVSGVTLAAGAPARRPVLTRPGGDVVTLASGNTVAGVGIDAQGSGSGIAGGTGDAGGTIADVRIVDSGVAATEPGLELDGTTGAFAISDLTVVGPATGVRLAANSGPVVFSPTGVVSITSTGASALVVSSTALGTSTFDLVQASGSATGGIELVNTTGTTTFSSVSLTTTSGTRPALALNSAGTVTVATGTAVASGGPAVSLAGTPAATVQLATASSQSSGSAGVSVDGGGAVDVAGGSISLHQGPAVDVNGGSGDVSYRGTVGNGPGLSLEVTNRAGGTVTTGSLTDTSDAGGGVSLSGNTGGATVLSGPVVLDTGASAGISLTSSTRHALSVTGGGLGISTTSGNGIHAAGGGTLSVTGTGNQVSTTTGRAVSVVNTTIGSGGLVLERVHTNGGANGIVLDSTGDSGSLRVTGSGGTCTAANTAGCTGGEIRSTTGGDDSSLVPVGAGIVLRNTNTPSLTRLWVHDHSNYAIRGNGVRGLAIADSVVSGTNGTNAASPYGDAAVVLENLTGSASITDTHVGGGLRENLRVVNATGSLNRLTLERLSLGGGVNGPDNDAVLLDSSGSASAFRVTVKDSTFRSARGDLLQLSHGAGSGDLVLSGNTFSNEHGSIADGGGGVSVVQSGTDTGLTMSVTGNSFRDAVGNAVLVVKGAGPSSQQGTFTNNTIGATGIVSSGSRTASALKLQLVSGGSSTWAVRNNTIRQYGLHGIEVVTGGGGAPGSGALDTTLTGNTVLEPGVNDPGIVRQGIHYNVGTLTGDTFQVCAGLSGNSVRGSGVDPVTPYDVRLRQRQSTSFRLPGYAGAPLDTAAVQSFVAGQNTVGGPAPSVSAAVSTNGFTGGGACALPPE